MRKNKKKKEEEEEEEEVKTELTIQWIKHSKEKSV